MGFLNVKLDAVPIATDISHVFSTYDSRNSAAEKYPSARGINSIQLIYDNNRWWVISILWNGETEEDPLPQKYLRMKK